MLKKISIIAAIILLSGQFCLELHLAKTDAQTTDEATHIFAGYLYLTQGNFRYNPEHPPLVKYIAALPLLSMHLNLPASYQAYNQRLSSYYFYGDGAQAASASDFLYRSGNDSGKILFWSRVPMTIVTLLLGIAIFCIAAYFWSWLGGLVAVSLYTTDPLINGHGHLVTTDVGVSLGVLLSLFTFWLFLKRSSWKRALIFGAVLGLTELAKFSAVLLYPIAICALICYALAYKIGWTEFWMRFGKVAVAFVFAFFVILAGYQFHMTPPPYAPSWNQAIVAANPDNGPQVPDKPFINHAYNALRYFAIPRDYYLGLLSFTHHADTGHSSFLLGKNSNSGWWYYFPIVFTAKTPIASMLIMLGAFALIIRKRKECFVGIYIISATLLYLALSCISKVDIGLRHVMPIYPLLFVSSGILGYRIISLKQKALFGITLALLLILIMQAAFTYPYYLSYFNELYGGKQSGYTVASDSNIDWGQDAGRIKEYIDKNNIKDPYIDYWDSAILDYYKISYKPFGQFKEGEKGTVIIGATSLEENAGDAWLKKYSPSDRITPSVFLYTFK